MDKSSLVQQQTTMGLYLRDPERNGPPTEMDPARALVYRDLVFANLSSLLSGTFPVLVKILGDEHWRSLGGPRAVLLYQAGIFFCSGRAEDGRRFFDQADRDFLDLDGVLQRSQLLVERD